MEFVAIAVRSANNSPFNLCQIAAARIDKQVQSVEIDILLDPRCDFDRAKVREHMINARSVRKAPQFGEVFPRIAAYLEGCTVIAFGPDARFAFEELCYRTKLKMPNSQWIDLGDALARALHMDEEIEQFGLIKAAETMGVDVPTRFANRWDAADEVALIKVVFAHLINRIKAKRGGGQAAE